MLSRLLAVKRVTSMGVLILPQAEPGKMPQSSGPGTTQQCPRLLPSSPGNWPVSCLGCWPLLSPGTNPGGLWEADVLSCFHVLGESYRSCFHTWPGLPDGRLPWGDRLPCISLFEGRELATGHLNIAHGSQDQVPLPQLARGPKSWSMAVAGAHAHPPAPRTHTCPRPEPPLGRPM